MLLFPSYLGNANIQPLCIQGVCLHISLDSLHRPLQKSQRIAESHTRKVTKAEGDERTPDELVIIPVVKNLIGIPSPWPVGNPQGNLQLPGDGKNMD